VVANIMTMVRCAGALIIMAEFQGGGLSEGRRARARHLHGHGAGDVQSLSVQPDFEQLRSVELAHRSFGGAPMPIATIKS